MRRPNRRPISSTRLASGRAVGASERRHPSAVLVRVQHVYKVHSVLVLHSRVAASTVSDCQRTVARVWRLDDAHIDMRTADGQIVPWLASQTDLLAEDWVPVMVEGSGNV